MGADLRSNAIDTSHALRTSGRATQFTGRFQTSARLKGEERNHAILLFRNMLKGFVHVVSGVLLSSFYYLEADKTVTIGIALDEPSSLPTFRPTDK